MTSVEKWLFALLAGTVGFILFSPAMMDLYIKLFGRKMHKETAMAIGMIISFIIVVLVYRYVLS